MERGDCTYFLTNVHNTVLYLGVTSDLVMRLYQHKTKEFTNSFTAHSIKEAIAREKTVKNGTGNRKIN